MSNLARRLLAIVILLAASSKGACAFAILNYDFDAGVDPVPNLGTLGSAYDGARSGGATFVTRGTGLAMSFDGDQDFVTPLGSPSAFHFGTADFSLRAVIRTSISEPGVDSRRFIAVFDNTGPQPKFALGVHRGTGQVTFGLADGASAIEVRSPFAVNDNLEHSILAVRNGSLLKLWVDGVFASEIIPGGFGSISPPPAVRFRVGGRSVPGNPGDDFMGVIDNFEVHDAALNDVPEPGSLTLLVPGLAALGGVAFRSRCRRPR